MNELSLWRDYEWEQFCASSENDSSTTDLEQVEYIRIHSNPPRNLLEIALTKLSQTIKVSSHLSCIQLYDDEKDLNHRLPSTVCEALLHSTAQQKIKVELIFGETSIDDNYFLPMANLMKNCKRDFVFCIEGGPILEDETLALFADALRHLSGAVKGLTLGSVDVGDDRACALAENLKVNRTLTELNLLWNSIGDDGAEALARALKQNETLTELDLLWNSIGDDGAEALARALKQNGALTELDLSGNSIGEDGAKALARALKQNGALTELDLSGNSIGDDGAEALARALKQNGALTELDLSENSIGDEGAKALAGALKINGTLTELILSYNSIGDDGAVALGEAIACNMTLDSLSLYSNDDITEKVGIEALVNGLNRNSTLTVLRLSWEHTGIQFALCRNKALLKEAAWMERFSDQDILLKTKMLSKAMERYSKSDFRELTFLFLQRERATLLTQAESVIESGGPAPKKRRV